MLQRFLVHRSGLDIKSSLHEGRCDKARYEGLRPLTGFRVQVCVQLMTYVGFGEVLNIGLPC